MSKKTKLIIGGVVGGFVVLLLALWAWGNSLPREHEVAMTAVYSQRKLELWATILDYQSFPKWRTDITEGRQLPGRRLGWVEVSRHGETPVDIVQAKPGQRLITRIVDADLPYGGTWTYDLEPDKASGGTRLTLTQNGIIKPAWLRIMAKTKGHHSTVEQYLRDLGSRYEETVEPELVPNE
ncbi:MAG: SRPBCC family protein [Acidobacteriota bacterium]